MAKRGTRGTKAAKRGKAHQVGAMTTPAPVAQRDAVTGALVGSGGQPYQVQRDSVTGVETLVPAPVQQSAPRATRTPARRRR